MSYAVKIQQLNGSPLAVIRRQVNRRDLSQVVPECCGRVWKTVRAQQVPAGRHVAIYWDGSIQLEVGVELHGPVTETGDVSLSTTPPGVVATVTHFGPYGGLGGARGAIRQWCTVNNRRLAGPSWEIYGHWDPAWNNEPSRIRTDVYYLLSDDADPV